MFDDQPIGNSDVPTNLPLGEPEDIFAGADVGAHSVGDIPQAAPLPTALGVGGLKPKSSMPSVTEVEAPIPRPVTRPTRTMPTGTGIDEHKIKGPSVLKNIFLIVLILVLLGSIVYAGWYAYGILSRSGSDVDSPSGKALVPISMPAEFVTDTPKSDKSAVDDDVLFGSVVDDDGDGLDNSRERLIGTDPAVSDTDGDGLSDGDEVNIWRTDPLDSDTDADGYTDGDEVKNGFNPLGPGKLPEKDDVMMISEDDVVPARASTSSASVSDSSSGDVSAGCRTNEECFLVAVDSCIASDINYAYRVDLARSLGVIRDESYMISISRGRDIDHCAVDIILKNINITFDSAMVSSSAQAEVEKAEKMREGKVVRCESEKLGLRQAIMSSKTTNLVDGIITQGGCVGSLIAN